MNLSTRHKIALARLAFHTVMPARHILGKDRVAHVRRGGIDWSLDLAEGIDFAIYLFDVFGSVRAPAGTAGWKPATSPKASHSIKVMATA